MGVAYASAAQPKGEGDDEVADNVGKPVDDAVGGIGDPFGATVGGVGDPVIDAVNFSVITPPLVILGLPAEIGYQEPATMSASLTEGAA